MATLYMVGVPIGNLEDITLRALRILGEVDFIACEDTRHSAMLLRHHGIQKRLFACHSHNEEHSAAGIVKEMSAGQNGAYISDAGTPGISDPGGRLVEAVVAAGHQVCPIPGPSALSTLLSVLGWPGKSIVFEGFLSPKAGRRTRQLAELLERADIGVVYESPFRIVALLENLQSICPQAMVVIGRELTKLHEEILRGPVEEVLASLKARQAIKGEFVLAIHKPGSVESDGESA